MPPDRVLCPDWRDAAAYGPLLRAEPAAFAWEWLRRDPHYRDAAGSVPKTVRLGSPHVLSADPAAARWGLHAFENPALPTFAARPVWRRDWLERVLMAEASTGGPARDRLDLGRFAGIATIVEERGGGEHLLLSDGAASLRIDVTAGSLLRGPARLGYQLAGFASARGPLETLRALLRLWHSGRLHRPSASSRNRRLILLLRAHDALQAGSNQREIAAVLLSGEALLTRWRSSVPSLRSQSQRLVIGARAMAKGGWHALLGG